MANSYTGKFVNICLMGTGTTVTSAVISVSVGNSASDLTSYTATLPSVSIANMYDNLTLVSLRRKPGEYDKFDLVINGKTYATYIIINDEPVLTKIDLSALISVGSTLNEGHLAAVFACGSGGCCDFSLVSVGNTDGEMLAADRITGSATVQYKSDDTVIYQEKLLKTADDLFYPILPGNEFLYVTPGYEFDYWSGTGIYNGAQVKITSTGTYVLTGANYNS